MKVGERRSKTQLLTGFMHPCMLNICGVTTKTFSVIKVLVLL